GMLGTTFGGNHLACAAAIAVLEVIRDENLLENTIKMGALLMKALGQLPGINNLRGKGLMIGWDPDESNKDIRSKLLNNQHIFTGSAKPNVVRLLPSLAINEKECNQFLSAISQELQVTKDEAIHIGA
nr:aminotransferase class III-fold pyridoxal phosphate-dependent enzyme [Saprospiraceae bacterium]